MKCRHLQPAQRNQQCDYKKPSDWFLFLYVKLVALAFASYRGNLLLSTQFMLSSARYACMSGPLMLPWDGRHSVGRLPNASYSTSYLCDNRFGARSMAIPMEMQI